MTVAHVFRISGQILKLSYHTVGFIGKLNSTTTQLSPFLFCAISSRRPFLRKADAYPRVRHNAGSIPAAVWKKDGRPALYPGTHGGNLLVCCHFVCSGYVQPHIWTHDYNLKCTGSSKRQQVGVCGPSQQITVPLPPLQSVCWAAAGLCASDRGAESHTLKTADGMSA